MRSAAGVTALEGHSCHGRTTTRSSQVLSTFPDFRLQISAARCPCRPLIAGYGADDLRAQDLPHADVKELTARIT